MKKYSLSKKSSLQLFNAQGCDYSKVDISLTIIGLLLAVSGICVYHELSFIYMLIVGVTTLIVIPFVLNAYFVFKSEKIRFEEYCKYFEYVKLYYKVHKKIKVALTETLRVFENNSNMKKCIEMAIKEIDDTGNYKKALGYIDEKYHNTYLERLHHLMILGETQGANKINESIDLVRFEDWKESNVIFQKKKKSARNWFYFLALLSLGVSAFGIGVFSSTDFVKMIVIDNGYQILTVVELELLILIFAYIYTSLLNKKWIRGDE
ncbi:MAG: hypothetical protein RSC93_07265 [Erysipelotrichaceae bacterium]